MRDSQINLSHISDSKEERIKQEAELWLVRLNSEDISIDLSEAFDAWLNESPLHIKAFDSIQSTYDSFDLINDEVLSGELGLIDPSMISTPQVSELEQPVSDESNVIPLFSNKKFYGLAAAIAMTVSVILITLNTPEIETLRYQTAIGESQQLSLDDGSILDLNTQTEIAVNYSQQSREIKLTSGEMHLGVASNKERPMLIDAGDVQVKVVGTEFNVTRLVNAITVSVLEGIVEVSSTGNIADNTSIIRLVANQKIQYQPGHGFGSITEIKPDNISSWKDGFLIYDTTDLDEVIMDINRYQTNQLTIADDKLSELEVSGIIHLANMGTVVETLESIFPIRAETDSSGEILLYYQQ